MTMMFFVQVLTILLVAAVTTTYAFNNDNFMIIGSRMPKTTTSSTMIMMARGRGNLKRNLDDDAVKSKKKKKGGAVSQDPINSLNEGKGQEITGVTLPASGTIKGWEFGEKKSMVCANVDDKFFAIQGDCPRCGFDLWKGTLIADDLSGFEDLPRVACPTCSQTFSMKSGLYGPPLKRKGLSGFVSGLAKSATEGDKMRNADAFQISLDSDTGRVFCKAQQRPKSGTR
jgi:nitrite reductase/ring-hydroxylating ferredoxin subunit